MKPRRQAANIFKTNPEGKLVIREETKGEGKGEGLGKDQEMEEEMDVDEVMPSVPVN